MEKRYRGPKRPAQHKQEVAAMQQAAMKRGSQMGGLTLGLLLAATCILAGAPQMGAEESSTPTPFKPLVKPLVLSLSTDKAVYRYTEPVRIEVLATNQTDTDWTFMPQPHSLGVRIHLYDLSADPFTPLPIPPAGQIPVSYISKTIPGHSQTVFEIAEIPAFLLKANRKYKIEAHGYLHLGREGDSTIYFAIADATRVITVQ